MSKSTEEQLQEAKRRAGEAMRRVRALTSKKSAEERRLDGRRKAVLGGWLLANRPELVPGIVADLKREQDRQVFAGWAPASASTTAAPGGGQESASA